MTTISPQAHQVDVPAAGRYRIDPDRSTVAFRTKHLFGLASVSGTMNVSGGDIVVDPAAMTASVSATVNTASFDTGNPRRDGDVRKAKFLDVEKYPEFTFRASALSQATDRWTLDGEMTVRGVANPVTLTIDRVETNGRGFVVRASTRIDRYAFGVTAAKGMAARYLDIELTAAADRSPHRCWC